MTVIEVHHLQKRYRNHVAVHDVSFTVEPGEIFGILGPNGAGKTTTVECIAGLRRPDGGQVRVLGLDPQRDRAALRRRLGVQLQVGALPERITVWEALDLYRAFYANPLDCAWLSDALGLTGQRHTVVRALSGGQRQRLSIGLALVGNPEVAVLDELTTGLDPQARRDIWQLIADLRARGVAVLLVTHSMEEAERLCDRLAMIDAGRVAALGDPSSIVARAGMAHQIRFRPSTPFDARILTDLPGVRNVTRNGATMVVSGAGDVIHAVTAVLARHQIIAADLRVEPATLEDAFVALTGRNLSPDQEGE